MEKDANHPWFRPLWVRVLVVAIALGMAVWDGINANYGWALLFGAAAVYGIYAFFITWTNQTPPDNRDAD